MRTCLFDPAIETHECGVSSNLGDIIISQAVRRELKTIVGEVPIYSIATHVFPTGKHLFQMLRCPLRFVGGTNLLSSNMDTYKQWKLNLFHASLIRKAILLGVGWWQYQEEPNSYTSKLLRRLLSPTHLHSVRDSYTEKKLQAVGFGNILNTGCPTMWPLANLRPGEIPAFKSNTVLLMLTDYYTQPVSDKKLVELLQSRYQKIYFWPQGRKDLKYISELGCSVHCLEHSLASLEKFIRETPSFDYVGTRLHGGIHCLLARRRSLILEVDNRATEIARQTGLPTAARDNWEAIRKWINGPTETKITMNTAAIEKWKQQFQTLTAR